MTGESHPRIQASDVVPMFPTLVWKIQLTAEAHEAIDAKIVAALQRMRRGDAGALAGPGMAVRTDAP